MVDAGCRHAVLEVSSHSLGPEARPRLPVPGRGLHQPDPRPPRLPRRHGRATSRPSALLFDTLLRADGHAIINADDDRAAELVARPRGARSGPTSLDAAGGPPRPRSVTPLPGRHPLPGRARPAGAARGRDAAHRPLQRPERAGRARAPVSPWACPGTRCCAGLASLRGVPGRLERVAAGQDFTVIVDYAHTDDALKNLLETVRELRPRRAHHRLRLRRRSRPHQAAAHGRRGLAPLGRRDRDLGQPAQRAARGDPRGDPPGDARAAAGPSATSIVDRRDAIARALEMARAGDVVVIAGKGHETYQVLRDRTVPFDDRQVARDVLRPPRRSGREEHEGGDRWLGADDRRRSSSATRRAGSAHARRRRRTRPVAGVSIDSRTLAPGQLFVADRRPSASTATTSWREAAARGAAAAVVHRDVPASAEGLPLVRVADTTRALGRPGAARARRAAACPWS